MSEFLDMPAFASPTGHTFVEPITIQPVSQSSFVGGEIHVIFVLGGPGAGKGTQCANLARDFSVQHLSVGDVLRKERDTPDSQYGKLIARNMEAGRIGPMEVTVELLGRAIQASFLRCKAKVFLVDGFPRKLDQLQHFENTVACAAFALFLDSTERIRLPRLLKRAAVENRQDDTPDVVQKRFHTFNGTCMAVVDYLEREGRLRRVNADLEEAEVYADIRRTFMENLNEDIKAKSLSLADVQLPPA